MTKPPNMRGTRLEPTLPPKGTEGNDQGMVKTCRMCIGSLFEGPQASINDTPQRLTRAERTSEDTV